MRRGWRASLCAVVLLGLCLAACASDDADGAGDDAGQATACGDQEPCDRATEICVRREFGAGLAYECVALPDGCDGDRTCAACSTVCEEPADTCADREEENTVACACIECRAQP
jgi:hypothetical protein